MSDQPRTARASRGSFPGGHPSRNPGGPLDLEWVHGARPDEQEIEAHLAKATRRTGVDESREVERLLDAIGSIDLTTLSGDDTPGRVRDLCMHARRPLPEFLQARIGPGARSTRTAAVCVYPHFLGVARVALQASGIPVAVVSAGFPAGLSGFEQRVDEVRSSARAGADEIDAVINRSHVLTGNWRALYDEVLAFREACGDARLKIILGTGDLESLQQVSSASRLCMLAGADFIKTSTGKEAVNATYPVGLVMLRAIADYRAATGHAVGFKPAGGIRTTEQALDWTELVREVLGDDWLGPGRFRIGASGLLGEIVARLDVLTGGTTVPAEEHVPRRGASY